VQIKGPLRNAFWEIGFHEIIKCTVLCHVNEIFKQINLYTLLIQGIRTTFTDQIPTFRVFSKAHSMLASEFSTVYQAVSQVLRMKEHNSNQHQEDT
jgi:hypothetical protein